MCDRAAFGSRSMASSWGPVHSNEVVFYDRFKGPPSVPLFPSPEESPSSTGRRAGVERSSRGQAAVQAEHMRAAWLLALPASNRQRRGWISDALAAREAQRGGRVGRRANDDAEERLGPLVHRADLLA